MIELPNRLNPNGRESDLANAVERSKQGKTVLRQQRYEIVSALAQDNRVAFEVQWTGVLAIPLGTPRSRLRDESSLRHVPRAARRQDQPPAQLRLLRALVAKCRGGSCIQSSLAILPLKDDSHPLNPAPDPAPAHRRNPHLRRSPGPAALPALGDRPASQLPRPLAIPARRCPRLLPRRRPPRYRARRRMALEPPPQICARSHHRRHRTQPRP